MTPVEVSPLCSCAHARQPLPCPTPGLSGSRGCAAPRPPAPAAPRRGRDEGPAPRRAQVVQLCQVLGEATGVFDVRPGRRLRSPATAPDVQVPRLLPPRLPRPGGPRLPPLPSPLRTHGEEARCSARTPRRRAPGPADVRRTACSSRRRSGAGPMLLVGNALWQLLPLRCSSAVPAVAERLCRLCQAAECPAARSCWYLTRLSRNFLWRRRQRHCETHVGCTEAGQRRDC